MNILLNIARIFVLVLAQALLFGQLPFGYGIHPMVYILAILLLPFNTRPVWLMLIAFIVGLSVDFFMNTFGLHASASVMMAFFRPSIYRRFSTKDEAEVLKEPSAKEMGYAWFLKTASILVLIHHLWFFTLEYLKNSAWLEIITNTFLSAIVTLTIFILIQVFFFKKPKKE